MDPTGVRTWYVDSRHCRELEDGGFELPLYENVELSEGQACYVDDLTIVGTQSNVSSNNRLYLFEYTPVNFNFLGSVKSHSVLDSLRTQLADLTIENNTSTDPAFSIYAYSVDFSDLGSTVFFNVDDTQLHWTGVYDIGAVQYPVHAQYSYLNGTARWTSDMPIQHRVWV